MSWFGFSMLCMCLSFGKTILAKRLLEKFDPVAFTFVDQMITMLVLLPSLHLKNILGLDGDFALILLSLLGPSLISVVSLSQATKQGEISEVSPLLIFLPVLVALTAPLFNDETLSSEGWLGIAMVTSGSYFLKLQSLRRPFEPFVKLLFEPSSRLMWITVIMGVWAAHLQGLLVLGYDARTALFFNSLGIALCLGPRIMLSSQERQKVGASLRSSGWWILILGLVSCVSSLSQFLAYQEGGQVAAVLSIKRISIIFIGFYGIMVLKERGHPGKYFGLFLMAFGGMWLYFE